MSAEGAPRGPPVGRGWSSDAMAALLCPGCFPRALRDSVLRHSSTLALRMAALSTHIREGWTALQRQGTGLEGSTLAAVGLGRLRGPAHSSLANGKACWRARPSQAAPGAGAGHSGSCSAHTTPVVSCAESGREARKLEGRKVYLLPCRRKEMRGSRSDWGREGNTNREVFLFN